MKTKAVSIRVRLQGKHIFWYSHVFQKRTYESIQYKFVILFLKEQASF